MRRQPKDNDFEEEAVEAGIDVILKRKRKHKRKNKHTRLEPEDDESFGFSVGKAAKSTEKEPDEVAKKSMIYGTGKRKSFYSSGLKEGSEEETLDEQIVDRYLADMETGKKGKYIPDNMEDSKSSLIKDMPVEVSDEQVSEIFVSSVKTVASKDSTHELSKGDILTGKDEPEKKKTFYSRSSPDNNLSFDFISSGSDDTINGTINGTTNKPRNRRKEKKGLQKDGKEVTRQTGKKSFYSQGVSAVSKAVDSTKKSFKKTKGTIDELTDTDTENLSENMVIRSASMIKETAVTAVSAVVGAIVAFVMSLASFIISFLGSIIAIIAIVTLVVVGVMVLAVTLVVTVLSLVVAIFTSLFAAEMEQTAPMHQYAYEYAAQFTQKVCDAIEEDKTIYYRMGTRFITNADQIDMDYETVYLIYIARNEVGEYIGDDLEYEKEKYENSKLEDILKGSEKYKASFDEIFDEIYSIEEDDKGIVHVEVTFPDTYWFYADNYKKYQQDNYNVFSDAVFNYDYEIKTEARKKLGMMSDVYTWKLDEPRDLE